VGDRETCSSPTPIGRSRSCRARVRPSSCCS
jgi:hypothetical protein